MRLCDEHIKYTISLAEAMIRAADRGDEVREDDGCGILYGELRDAGYKIRALALREKENHMRKGLWRE